MLISSLLKNKGNYGVNHSFQVSGNFRLAISSITRYPVFKYYKIPYIKCGKVFR